MFFILLFNSFSLLFECCPRLWTSEFGLFHDPMLLWGQYFFHCQVSRFIYFPNDNADICATDLLMIYYNFFSPNFFIIVITTLYNFSNRFFGKHKAVHLLFIVISTSSVHFFAVHLLHNTIKSLESISDEWSITVC